MGPHPGTGSGRRARWAVAAVALALALGVLGAATAGASSSPTPDVALAQLNAWRQIVGVQPVALDPALSDGCRRHTAYVQANPQAQSHEEAAGTPGFSTAGDLAARTSVLAFGRDDNPGVRVWEPTPYHRMALLDPRLAATGFWSEFGVSCMGVSDLDAARHTPDVRAYPYPVPGQRAVATSFACNEVPDPCLEVPGRNGRGPTGFIVSVQFNGPWVQLIDAHVQNATLTPAHGDPVALTVDSSDSALRDGFLLIPHRPLASGTTYAAAASGTLLGIDDDGSVAEHRFGVAWDFSTPGVAPDASLTLALERVTRERIRLRLELESPVARRARISLLRDRTPLLRTVRELRAGTTRITLRRPRLGVTSVAVLLRGEPSRAGVAARLRTRIRSR